MIRVLEESLQEKMHADKDMHQRRLFTANKARPRLDSRNGEAGITMINEGMASSVNRLSLQKAALFESFMIERSAPMTPRTLVKPRQ